VPWAERPVDILLPAIVSSFHCICSRHVHVIACPPPNIVYPCCSSSPRKTFSFYFTSIVARTKRIASSLPVAVLREFPVLNNICFKMPFSSGIPIFSRIHLLAFHSVQLILSIRLHTYPHLKNCGWLVSTEQPGSNKIYTGWLVGLVFNGTFSTKRLYRAMRILQVC